MPSLAALADAHQDRLLARADHTADAAESVVQRVWAELMAVLERGGHWYATYTAILAILHKLKAAPAIVAADLAHVATDSALWSAQVLARKLTVKQLRFVLRSRGYLESEKNLLSEFFVSAILPPITAEQINAVLYQHGWVDRIKSLTSLASPETLAAKIAGLIQVGKSIAEIAREIRPEVQGVQVSARRVARTAGLWIAHEAEMHTYEQLGPEMIEGYQVHAVDNGQSPVSRPAHRKRHGTKYYRRPKQGEKGFDEMPRPPRESPKDGDVWAFNCRCFLSPLLKFE